MVQVGWYAQSTPVCLGYGRPFRARWWQRERPLWWPTDVRLKHAYITGGSGSGKTVLLKRTAQADIAANRSITVIDPHSDAYAELLAYAAFLALPGPLTAQAVADLGDKLVLFDFGRGDWAPGVNVLAPGAGEDAFTTVDGIIAVMRDLWEDAWGDRMADVLRQSLMCLQSLSLTFAEMLPFISDHEVRDLLVARCPLPETKLYFQQHLGTLRPQQQHEWLESSRNKISAFLAAPSVRAMLGQQRSTVDFREIIDGRILLVNLAKTRLKESRRLVGGLLLNKLHSAGVSRLAVPEDRRLWHQILIDEFQELYCNPLHEFLSGSRKLGVGIAAFHQNLRQKPFDREPAMIDTLLSNSSTQIAFSASRQDAQRLAGELFAASGTEVKMQRSLLGIPLERPTFWAMPEEREYHQTALMHQQVGQAYVKFRGHAEPYELRVPYAPEQAVEPEKIEAVREHALRRYCRDVAEVNREINDRWARLRREASAVTRRRHDFNR